MKRLIYRWMLFFPVIFLSGSLNLKAQEVEEAIEEAEVPSMFERLMQTEQGELLLLIGGLLVVLIVLLIVLTVLMVQTANLVLQKKPIEAGEERLSVFDRFKQRWITGRMKPVGQDGDMLLDHNYDGIQEMDYKMPPWLSYIFIGTFLFAVFYIPAYLYWDLIPDQQTEYQLEIQEAAILAEKRTMAGFAEITAETAQLRTDVNVIEAGKKIFQANCAVCHAADGGGGVGPNLADEYWIHGAEVRDIFTVVAEGVPQKGMIPWKGQLTPKQMEEVTNYIVSLAGTTPAAPKEPQGEPVKRETAEERVDAAVEENLPEEFDQ